MPKGRGTKSATYWCNFDWVSLLQIKLGLKISFVAVILHILLVNTWIWNHTQAMYDILDFSWLVRFHSLIIRTSKQCRRTYVFWHSAKCRKISASLELGLVVGINLWKLLEHRDLTIRLVVASRIKKIRAGVKSGNPPFYRNDVLFSLPLDLVNKRWYYLSEIMCVSCKFLMPPI